MFTDAGSITDIVEDPGSSDDSYLGGGCFSRVYDMGDGWVSKVCKKTRDGCLTWLVWSTVNQGKPGVPELRNLRIAEDGSYAVELRKYEGMMSGEHNMLWDGTYLRTSPSRVNLCRKDAACMSTVERFEREVLAEENNRFGSDGRLLGQLSSAKCHDLHMGNFMWDRKRGMICTDPLAYNGWMEPQKALWIAEQYA